MNSLDVMLDKYKSNIDSSLDLVKNNISYVSSFKGSYIASKIELNLDTIVEEVEKVKESLDTLVNSVK